LQWSLDNAYASSFPDETKRFRAAGWHFSTDQALDLAVTYQLNAKPAYLDAILGNLNFEAGCNPMNVSYVSGLGSKRSRNLVSQWAANAPRSLPPSGLPMGNMSAPPASCGKACCNSRSTALRVSPSRPKLRVRNGLKSKRNYPTAAASLLREVSAQIRSWEPSPWRT
jgi:hypothetical protein